MDPVSASVSIDRPREEVFAYLVDIANHAEFTDHYLKHFRLTRVDSVGRGAGARFKFDSRLQRFGWSDTSFVTVDAPHRIVAVGRGGKFNRIRTTAIWTLDRAPGGGTDVEYMFETEPLLPTDRFVEAATGQRAWFKRKVRRALRRLQSILEENEDRGARATVAGV